MKWPLIVASTDLDAVLMVGHMQLRQNECRVICTVLAFVSIALFSPWMPIERRRLRSMNVYNCWSFLMDYCIVRIKLRT